MLGVLKIRVEWGEGRNVEQMWEQMKQTMVHSARKVLLCEDGGKNPNNDCRNDVV